ncbi:unnamed protein product [Protopolystoma xenopodis]|uniref:Uncharacterized protein n=1 Tax=Protopolystoma xenopodis TaxID=117903 RepID=A0A448WFG2_9PLAT|nr:unnamed protein product [Protopolystoma xenopodis]
MAHLSRTRLRPGSKWEKLAPGKQMDARKGAYLLYLSPQLDRVGSARHGLFIKVDRNEGLAGAHAQVRLHGQRVIQSPGQRSSRSCQYSPFAQFTSVYPSASD